MAIGIAHVQAPAAVDIVELAGLLVARVGAELQPGLCDAREDRVELLVAHRECVVLGRDVLRVAEVELGRAAGDEVLQVRQDGLALLRAERRAQRLDVGIPHLGDAVERRLAAVEGPGDATKREALGLAGQRLGQRQVLVGVGVLERRRVGGVAMRARCRRT